MCKLLAIVDIEDKAKALSFTKTITHLMGMTDSDGLGILRLGDSGISWEKWLNPKNAPRHNACPIGLEKWSGALSFPHETYGEVNQDPFAVGAHARFATCKKGLENVHPFMRDGLALIHNGVIENSFQFKNAVSTCDSEAILTSYIENDIKGNFQNMEKALKPLHGSYAFMVFSDSGYVDIVKDDDTPLYIAKVRNVGTVICTLDTLISKTCKLLKIRKPLVTSLNPLTAIRWHRGGEIEIQNLSPSILFAPAYMSQIDAQEKQEALYKDIPDNDKGLVNLENSKFPDDYIPSSWLKEDLAEKD